MPETGRRYAFVIAADGAADALVRVLILFAVQPLALASVSSVWAEDGCAIRVEADALDDQRAELLRRRLCGLPIVRSVGLGWTGGQRDPRPETGPAAAGCEVMAGA